MLHADANETSYKILLSIADKEWHKAVCRDCKEDGHCRVPYALRKHVDAHKQIAAIIREGKLSKEDVTSKKTYS